MPQRNTQTVKVTFANNTKSGAFSLDGYAGGHVFFPAAVAGTSISFEQLDPDNTNYSQIQSGGSAVSMTITAGAKSWVPLPTELFGAGEVKLVSNQTEGVAAALVCYVRLSD